MKNLFLLLVMGVLGFSLQVKAETLGERHAVEDCAALNESTTLEREVASGVENEEGEETVVEQ